LKGFKKIYDQISVKRNTSFEIRTKFQLKFQAKILQTKVRILNEYSMQNLKEASRAKIEASKTKILTKNKGIYLKNLR
jgi:hypothetical protein